MVRGMPRTTLAGYLGGGAPTELGVWPDGVVVDAPRLDDPADDPEVYRKTSPMTYIKQAKTPTLSTARMTPRIASSL